MTQSLQELLATVRSVEPEAAEWSGVQARVSTALNAAPLVTNGSNDAAFERRAAQGQATRSGGFTMWLGGGIAVGAVVAGLMFATQSAGPFAQVVGTDTPTGAFTSHPIDLGVIDGPRAEKWSPRREARMRVRRPAQTQPITAPDSAPVSSTNNAPQPRVSAMGESDVEYDRRHLAPIDAALQAHQPLQALELLAAFEPRKLTNYARALEAIARCNLGQAEQGKQVGQRALPQLTNQGLARRVRAACELLP